MSVLPGQEDVEIKMFLEGPSPGVSGGEQPSPDGFLKVPELESVFEFEDQRVPAGPVNPLGVPLLVVQIVDLLYVEEGGAIRSPLEDKVKGLRSKRFLQSILHELLEA